MVRIVVTLNPDRNVCGELTLRADSGRILCGPLAVSGRASDAPAERHDNPSRLPLLCYGDTPTGSYRVSAILSSGEETSYDAGQFGPNGIVVLDAISGDAALAEANGRFHLFIQGGTAGRGRRLRSTNGCLRLFDDDLKKLLEKVRALKVRFCECAESPEAGKSRLILVDNSYVEGDPPVVMRNRGKGWAVEERGYSRRAALKVAGVALGGIVLENRFSLGRAVKWIEMSPSEALAQAHPFIFNPAPPPPPKEPPAIHGPRYPGPEEHPHPPHLPEEPAPGETTPAEPVPEQTY